MEPGTTNEPLPPELERIIVPRTRDLGDGFQVHRALPAIERRMVGPFIFFDQIGPALLREGHGVDVRPHPHIGLATVTYLFQGALLHRDSLGTVQRITPGEVNWMTAGRGIVHSERSPADERTQGHTISGIQLWVALPKADEEVAPSFEHFGAEVLPVRREKGLELRLIAGKLDGLSSPVPTRWPMFYADAQLDPGAELVLKPEHDERALYPLTGRLEVAGHPLEPGRLLILSRSAEVRVRALEPARVLLLGGATMDGPRQIVWNFVSSSLDRIRHAADDWRNERFPRVPGETERIPLPHDLPHPVDYP